MLQLTARANYRRYGKLLGLDLEGQPHIAAEPLVSLRIACVYWRDRNINPLCDADDLVAVTRKVNGGTNGLADRGRYLAKAKAALARPAPAPVVATAEAETVPAPSAGLLSNITSTTSSASAINALAAEGSRLAATIQGVFRWFWTILFGGTAVAGTVKTTVNPDAGTAAIVNAWVSAHPFLFAGCAIGLLLVLQYVGLWVLRKYFITAVKDNRYQPRGVSQ